MVGRPIAFRGVGIPIQDLVTVGKWDLFCSWGVKIQDGEEFIFDEISLGQMVRNFASSKRPKLGMDYEHQTLYASVNGQPAPQLAYYNALCVIKGGRVLEYATKDASVTPPDAARMVDGLYGYRCEITPLGQELLPNYHEISPLFTVNDTDEEGNEIGYRLHNVSAVSVAFQDGTTINFKKMSSKSKKGFRMEDKEFYAKLGLSEEASPEEAMAAMKGYMARMSEVDGKDKAEDKDKDGMAEEVKEEDKAMAADADVAKEHQEVMKKMSAELSSTRQRLAALETEKSKRDEEEAISRAKAFSLAAVSDGRWPSDGIENLTALAKIGKGEEAIKPFARGTFSLGKKSYRGTAEISPLTDDSPVMTKSGLSVVGMSLAKMAREHAAQEKVSLSSAYRAMSKKHPHLY